MLYLGAGFLLIGMCLSCTVGAKVGVAHGRQKGVAKAVPQQQGRGVAPQWPPSPLVLGGGIDNDRPQPVSVKAPYSNEVELNSVFKSNNNKNEAFNACTSKEFEQISEKSEV